MSVALAKLIDNISLEQIENNLFRGKVIDDAKGAISGGQVLAQAVHAARATVSSRFILHSMHCYFLRPGDTDFPVIYEVDRIRDGRNFTTRRIIAIQHGRAIFNVSLSFQQPEKGKRKLERQDDMPQVVGPEELLSDENYFREVYTGSREIPKAWPVEYRQVDPIKANTKSDARQLVWMKADGHLAKDLSQHQELLAYATYHYMIITSLRPFGLSPWEKGMHAVSLDHSMWLHRPFRMDDWLLYDIHSSTASGERVFVQGKVFNRRRQLIASTTQEGLVRFSSAE